MRTRAGHSKFSHKQLIDMERDFLVTLKYRVHRPQTIFNEVALLFTTLQEKQEKVSALVNSSMKKTAEYLVFLCYLTTYSYQLSS